MCGRPEPARPKPARKRSDWRYRPSPAFRLWAQFNTTLGLTFVALLWAAAAVAQTSSTPRIVVMDAGHAQIVDALGLSGHLMLMPDDDYMRERLPDVSVYRHQLSLESILETRSDIVLAGNPGRDQDFTDQLRRLNVRTVMVDRSLPAIDRIRTIAELLNRQTQGEELIDAINEDYSKAGTLQGIRSPRVLHVSSSGAGSTGAVTGAGRATPAHALIERAGAINSGAEAGLERYQTLSAEGVMAMAPEAVVVSDLELAALGGRDGIWNQVPGLRLTPAAEARHLIVMSHAALKFDAVDSGEATLALTFALHPR